MWSAGLNETHCQLFNHCTLVKQKRKGHRIHLMNGVDKSTAFSNQPKHTTQSTTQTLQTQSSDCTH